VPSAVCSPNLESQTQCPRLIQEKAYLLLLVSSASGGGGRLLSLRAVSLAVLAERADDEIGALDNPGPKLRTVHDGKHPHAIVTLTKGSNSLWGTREAPESVAGERIKLQSLLPGSATDDVVAPGDLADAEEILFTRADAGAFRVLAGAEDRVEEV
jgi:hypothetical protein